MGTQSRPAHDGAGPGQKNTAPADRRRQREVLHRHRPAACSVRRGCKMIDLPRSTFYYRSTIRASNLCDADLVAVIEDIQDEFPCYGCRRVTHELRRRGHFFNHKRVARVMRANELGIKPRKRYVRTTDSSHDSPIYPNLYRNLIPDRPDRVWVADFTYIRISAGFCYLAVILDACSRKVVGYGLSKRLDTPLALAALRSAIESRKPAPGCIHHTDRGCQYASESYRRALGAAGLKGSMSAVGNPYHNAQAESFMKTLKVEDIYPRWLRDLRGRRRAIAQVHRGGLQCQAAALSSWLQIASRI
ncbi:IS3 family transposase [Sinorhizobium medicae]|nr:IS3 family transposase [Sinorhizobium medicae]